jgi:hypothetical protein
VPHRVRLASVFVGLVALAGLLDASGVQAAAPSLTLNINANGGLDVVLGNGTRIRTSSAPGIVIPPGPYLAIVRSEVPDDRDVFHMFHLSGAGVNIVSDLLPCENPRELLTITLQPSSTYVYEDSRHPELGRIVFTTSSSGSSAETSSSAGGPATGKYSGSVSNSSGVGSDIVPFRGTLHGTADTLGRVTLARNGKRVSSLKAGRYKLVVVDKASRSGFILDRPNLATITVTTSPFVGTRTKTVTLTPGGWSFHGAVGALHDFTVVP